MHGLALPDDLIGTILHFAVDSLLGWSWAQRVCRQFRACAHNPWALSHLTVDVPNARFLDHLGPTVHGVSDLQLRSETGFQVWPASSVRRLAVRGASRRCLAPIGQSVDLRHLDLTGCDILDRDLAGLSVLLHMQTLHLNGFRWISDLEPLSAMLKLRTLHLKDCGQISNLKPLSRLVELTTLSLQGCCAVTDESLEALQPLTHLRHLNLSDCALSDQGLSSLSHLTELQVLVLSGCNEVGNAGLQRLAKLQLHELYLDGCYSVSAAGLGALSDMKTLQRLHLYATAVAGGIFFEPLVTRLRFLHLPFPITDAVLPLMEGMVQLEQVRLAFPLTDEGMWGLVGLTGLRSLHVLKGSRVTDRSLRKLSSLTRLTCLTLCGLRTTGDGLSALSTLDSLTSLDLSGSRKISCAALACLRPLLALLDLNLSDCRVRDESVEHLSGLTNLRTLKLRGARITDRSLVLLARLHRLRVLDLSHCSHFTDDGLRALTALHTTLENLNLKGCSLISDQGVAELMTLTVLNRLNVSRCRITDVGLEHIGQWPSLRSLNVAACKGITDRGFCAWRAPLKFLNLSGCSELTDAAVRNLARPSLTNLNLSDCEQITDGALGCLHTCPELKTLDVSLCDRITSEGLSALAHIDDISWFLCFGVSTPDDAETESVIEPNAHVRLRDEHHERSAKLLIRALLDYKPRENTAQRCFFIELLHEDRVVLSTSVQEDDVSVDVDPNSIDWVYIATWFHTPKHNQHARWVFFSGLHGRIRVHARSCKTVARARN